ncbi:MAG: glycosyltransferase family 2 protein [Chloroflexi bacterium]|nr:glycosyltransferase family 2 protein [Chloroflexota bacterium]MBU1750738.1 glycosyltransferase family 2 protein [Chloroflexota bacterium]
MAQESLSATTIVIPAYNEERGIGPVIDELRAVLDAASLSYEILIVDDGSADATAEIARAKGVTVVRHPRNMGYGAALKTGIRRAQYDLVAITDADGTYPAPALPGLIAAMRDVDMAVGARTGGDVHIPLARRPAKWVLNQVANYLSGTKIPDLNSGLRVFKRDVAQSFFRLLPNGFSFTTSITLAMLTSGHPVLFVPIDYRPRAGRSKIRPVRDTLGFLSLIVRTVMYFNPLRIFMPLSLLFLGAGVAKTAYDVATALNVSTSDMLLVMTGILIGTLGLLADLIDKRL